MLGTKVYSTTKIAESNVTIDISNQAKGIYFVRFYEGDKMVINKIVIQ